MTTNFEETDPIGPVRCENCGAVSREQALVTRVTDAVVLPSGFTASPNSGGAWCLPCDRRDGERASAQAWRES